VSGSERASGSDVSRASDGERGSAVSEGRQATPEQAAAVSIRDRDVLLEAGAGTGKTGVLVDRYCALIADDGLVPDQVLAFTFTEKAAAQLRDRIRLELARRAAQTSDETKAVRLGRIVSEFGGAWVTTIHGFCRRLLAAHPVAAGIDPGFRVLDESEAERAARAAFDAALEDFLVEGDDERATTVAAYRIDGLRELVVAAHAELRSRGHEAPRLPEPPASDPEESLARLERCAMAALDGGRLGRKQAAAIERARELGAGRAGAEPTIDDLAGLDFNAKAGAAAECLEALKEAKSRVAERDGGVQAYRHVAELLRLFGRRFAEAKAQRSGLDFEDLQLLTVRLLHESEAVLRAYRGRFAHLLVDEFQDTNGLQLELVEALRGPTTRLFLVGDEFQSIYGFRHADLEVFREQRRRFEANPDAEVLRLSGNFRARPELIAATNSLGGGLIGPGFRPLTVGAEPPPEPAGPAGPRVDLLLTGKEGWDDLDLELAVDDQTPKRYVAEARFLAGRLRELADAGTPRGEMVVLLRAFTRVDAYEEALERAGLRPYVVGGRGYWSQQQVEDVRALLAVIANPLDDEHLPAADLERLAGFHAQVAALREAGTRLGLEELIERAVADTGYDLAALMRRAGRLRIANVRKLMRLAREFEAREGRDLRGFLDYLDFRSGADDEASAATEAEDHDGVRVMTIHNAKGLEFGIVAVPDLDRGLLLGGRDPYLWLGREGAGEPRVGMRLVRLGAASIPIFDFDELRSEHQERESAEALRLFYVAATRARDRLILSGVVPESIPAEEKPGTSVICRLVRALGLEEALGDGQEVQVAAPDPRPGLAAAFPPASIAVRRNEPSPERAAELVASTSAAAPPQPLGQGPPPLSRPAPAPAPPLRPLSYSALSSYERCGYRFYVERVLGLRPPERAPVAGENGAPGRDDRLGFGSAVHELLEWSALRDWIAPGAELAERSLAANGVEPAAEAVDRALGQVAGWAGSPLCAELRASGARLRAEVPLLLSLAGSVIRGSIDLLAEAPGRPPLVVDYKTDSLEGTRPDERADGYRIQRLLYAVAAAAATGAERVRVAYVFLERPEEPIQTELAAGQIAAARAELGAIVARIGAGEFTVTAEPDWPLCHDCPARLRLCSAPAAPPAPRIAAAT
jgi:ATP-dependent helicase/nuclease subunit A